MSGGSLSAEALYMKGGEFYEGEIQIPREDLLFIKCDGMGSLDGFQITFNSKPYLRLETMVHKHRQGGMEWASASEFVFGGSEGFGGVAFRLGGADAAYYTLRYRVRFARTGWTDFVSASEFEGTRDKSRAMEAFELRIEPLRRRRRRWVRLCHSTANESIVWDCSSEEVKRKAKNATSVRIQQKDDHRKYVQSKPDSYPIEDIRDGRPIGFDRALSKRDVSYFWEASEEFPGDMSNHLWHSFSHWSLKACSDLRTKIYHCCDNPGGIHWTDSSDLSVSKWSLKEKPAELELYVNERSESDDSDSDDDSD